IALDEGDAACGAEIERALVGNRWPHDASLRLPRKPAYPQADRGSLRLGQNGRRTRKNQISRARARRLGLHLCGRRLQSNSATEAHGGARMRAPMNCKLVGRWRIVEADIWDRQIGRASWRERV